MSRRHKQQLKPISYEDLVSSSSMEGLVSFLNHKPLELGDQKITGISTPAKETASLPTAPETPSGRQRVYDPSNIASNAQVAAAEGLPTEAVPATVGETPTLSRVHDPSTITSKAQIAATEETPTVGVSPTKGVPATVGETPTVLRVHDPLSVETVAIQEAPTVGLSATEGVPCPVIKTATSSRVHDPLNVEIAAVEEPPTVEVTLPSVRSVPANETPIVSRLAPTLGPPTVPTSKFLKESEEPTVGVTPRFWRSSRGGIWPTERVSKISVVQDSMTLAESACYDLLWKTTNLGAFKVLYQDKQSKVIQASWDALARILRVNEKTLRESMFPSLVSKFAVGVETPNQNVRGQRAQATIYRIFSFTEILSRQKAAGYFHRIKNGRAIELVKPLTEEPKDESSSMAETTTVGTRPTVVESSTPTVGVPAAKTVGVPTKHLKLEHSFLEQSKSRTNDVDENDVETLEEQILGSEFSTIDRNAIRSVWKQSREAVPDASPEEVFVLFRERALTLGKSAKNVTGLLLWGWKEYFTPARIRILRDKRRQAREAAQQEREVNIVQWQSWLLDPNVPEPLKRFARDSLTEAGVIPPK